MKSTLYKLSIFLLLSLPETVIAQKESHWIPKQFVEQMLVKGKDRDISNLIKPIQYIFYTEKEMLVKSFGGEKKKARYIKLSKDSFKITNVESLINLKYIDREYVKKDFILKIKKERISLYIGRGEDQQRIDFIDRIEGFKFGDFEESVFRVQLTGNYIELVQGDSNKVQFNIDGSIQQSRFWSGYRVAANKTVAFQNNTMYRLIRFTDKQQKETILAVTLKDDYLLLYRLANKKPISIDKDADYKYIKSY